MRGVIILIRCKSAEENLSKQYQNHKIKYLTICLSVLLTLGSNVIYYRIAVKREYESGAQTAVSVIMWII